MIASIFKRVEIFQPYHVPIQPLIICQTEKKEKQKKPQNLDSVKDFNSSDIPIEEDHPQNDSTSCSGESDKIASSSFKAFKFLLNKKRKNSNLVKCYKCNVDDCETLFETKEELETHKKGHEILYKCTKDGCNLQFMHEKNLQKHQKTHCILIKRYLCPFPGCGKGLLHYIIKKYIIVYILGKGHINVKYVAIIIMIELTINII